MRPSIRLIRSSAVFGFFAMAWLSVPSQAQMAVSGLQHVRWPLLDMVMFPDSSAGVWLLVAPNPATKQWEHETPVVSLAVEVIQWVTIARGLMRPDQSLMPNAMDRLTPRLRGSGGPAFTLLAENRAKAGTDQAYVLVVSDARSHTQWKTFASSVQVDSMLSSLQSAAMESRLHFTSEDPGVAIEEDSVDTPVRVVAISTPEYPRELASKRRVGRVWMMYVVGPDGRAVERSFRPLLSDDPLFTRAALEALRHAKYKPALRNGKPVAQRVFQVITFRMY
jgi:TonB family protein